MKGRGEIRNMAPSQLSCFSLPDLFGKRCEGPGGGASSRHDVWYDVRRACVWLPLPRGSRDMIFPFFFTQKRSDHEISRRNSPPLARTRLPRLHVPPSPRGRGAHSEESRIAVIPIIPRPIPLTTTAHDDDRSRIVLVAVRFHQVDPPIVVRIIDEGYTAQAQDAGRGDRSRLHPSRILRHHRHIDHRLGSRGGGRRRRGGIRFPAGIAIRRTGDAIAFRIRRDVLRIEDIGFDIFDGIARFGGEYHRGRCQSLGVRFLRQLGFLSQSVIADIGLLQGDSDEEDRWQGERR
jgi:hypothetical protein